MVTFPYLKSVFLQLFCSQDPKCTHCIWLKCFLICNSFPSLSSSHFSSTLCHLFVEESSYSIEFPIMDLADCFLWYKVEYYKVQSLAMECGEEGKYRYGLSPKCFRQMILKTLKKNKSIRGCYQLSSEGTKSMCLYKTFHLNLI